MDARVKRGETALPPLVNWREVCLDLKRNGYGPQAIARRLGVRHTTVQRWANNNCEPGWHSGTRLLHLWAVVVFGAATNARLIYPAA